MSPSPPLSTNQILLQRKDKEEVCIARPHRGWLGCYWRSVEQKENSKHNIKDPLQMIPVISPFCAFFPLPLYSFASSLRFPSSHDAVFWNNITQMSHSLQQPLCVIVPSPSRERGGLWRAKKQHGQRKAHMGPMCWWYTEFPPWGWQMISWASILLNKWGPSPSQQIPWQIYLECTKEQQQLWDSCPHSLIFLCFEWVLIVLSSN